MCKIISHINFCYFALFPRQRIFLSPFLYFIIYISFNVGKICYHKSIITCRNNFIINIYSFISLNFSKNLEKHNHAKSSSNIQSHTLIHFFIVFWMIFINYWKSCCSTCNAIIRILLHILLNIILINILTKVPLPIIPKTLKPFCAHHKK